MAKRDKKKKDQGHAAVEAVDAVRAAVERTFSATTEGAQTTRDRTRDLFDEVVSAVGRIRETVEDLGVLEDVRGLRREIEALSRRIAQLEAAQAAQAVQAAQASATPEEPAEA